MSVSNSDFHKDWNELEDSLSCVETLLNTFSKNTNEDTTCKAFFIYKKLVYMDPDSNNLKQHDMHLKKLDIKGTKLYQARIKAETALKKLRKKHKDKTVYIVTISVEALRNACMYISPRDLKLVRSQVQSKLILQDLRKPPSANQDELISRLENDFIGTRLIEYANDCNDRLNEHLAQSKTEKIKRFSESTESKAESNASPVKSASLKTKLAN